MVSALVAWTLVAPAGAEPLRHDEVPEPLRPWVGWVLHGERDSLCPILLGQDGVTRCAWPGKLELVLDDHGGRFTQSWTVDVDSAVPLPGGAGRFPEDVKLDGAGVVPLVHGGAPHLRLAPGSHTVSGSFRWDTLPEALEVAPEVALVGLTLRGATVAFPNRDAAGRLWLGRAVEAPAEEERVTVRVSRRVTDEVPLQLATRIELAVSGKAREVHLGPALLPGFTPLSLTSALAARLESDGRLRVQVRPGEWRIDLVARHDGRVATLALAPSTELWSEGGEEVWVWDARPALRVVEIEGVTAVDPQQTTLQEDWKSLPAYRMAPGETMTLTERRRGNDPPEPDRLTLARELWLDFDGGGYTVRDHMTGSLDTSFRLEMPAPTVLGRVTLDGRDQVVTRRPGADRDGIEVRHGSLELGAESRIEGALRTLPAVSWDADVEGLSSTLHVPPGWRVLAVRGADRVPGTWVENWTLLDFFLVLIAALAFRRLFGWTWGGIALVGLVLIHPEEHGFAWLVLVVLALEAALRLLHEGKARRWAGGAWIVVAGYLALVSVPFLVWQVRTAMYPALAQYWYTAPDGTSDSSQPDFLRYPTAPAAAPMQARGMNDERGSEQTLAAGEEPAPEAKPAPRAANRPAYTRRFEYAKGPLSSGFSSGPSEDLDRIDPNAVVNTGPGIPSWSWSAVELQFSGPVHRTQEVTVYLLSPVVNAVLNVLRAALLAALVLRLLDWRKLAGGLGRAPRLAAAALIAASLVTTATPARAELPSQELLDQLEARLTERPECHPRCASLARGYFDASGGRLKIRLEVAALADTAIPLPGGASSWLPSQLLVDAKPATAIRDSSGTVWALVPAGARELLLDGPLPERDDVTIPLPLAPTRVEVVAPGFTVDGVHENGQPDSSLTLRRERSGPVDPDRLDAESPQILPSFLLVTRQLDLGLQWGVETRVTRLSPGGVPATAQIPLLPGESVTSENVRVEKGHVLVTLAAGADEVGWLSTLEQKGSIELVAPGSADFVEVWRLGASNLWHVETAGLAPIHPGSSTGVRIPEWHPWPGEKLELAISRPEGVPGATLTIDSSRLAVSPGLRSTDCTLELSIRSSRGGRHVVTLPPGVELTAVYVGGISQPLRMEASRVTLPINPGSQLAKVVWREPRGLGTRFTTPSVDVGAPSVNSTVFVEPSPGRWVLYAGGPRLGPAVLFWSTLAVLLVIAIGLGRLTITPLRAYHWFGVGIGLTQLPVQAGAVVAVWLLGLGLRRERIAWLGDPERRRTFNLVQVVLALLTIAALGVLFVGIQAGLLGQPEMQIRGNGSTASGLRWFSDRSGATLPTAWLVSVPLWAYRLAMLAWALWIAASLIRWLKWGWESFTTGGGWKPAPPKPKRGIAAPPAAPSSPAPP